MTAELLRKHVSIPAKLLFLAWIFLASKTPSPKHHQNIDDETDYDTLDVFIALSSSPSRSPPMTPTQRPRSIQFRPRLAAAAPSASAPPAFDGVLGDDFQMLNTQQLLPDSMLNDSLPQTSVWEDIENQLSMNEGFEEEIPASQATTTDSP